MPGRLISGGGAILRLCSPQYICSSSILLQYMSSSYLLYETKYIQCFGDIISIYWCVTFCSGTLIFMSWFVSVLTSFPCASAAHHLSVSSAQPSVSASSACFPAVFLHGYWAWSQLEALDSPFSNETEYEEIIKRHCSNQQQQGKEIRWVVF